MDKAPNPLSVLRSPCPSRIIMGDSQSLQARSSLVIRMKRRLFRAVHNPQSTVHLPASCIPCNPPAKTTRCIFPASSLSSHNLTRSSKKARNGRGGQGQGPTEFLMLPAQPAQELKRNKLPLSSIWHIPEFSGNEPTVSWPRPDQPGFPHGA